MRRTRGWCRRRPTRSGSSPPAARSPRPRRIGRSGARWCPRASASTRRRRSCLTGRSSRPRCRSRRRSAGWSALRTRGGSRSPRCRCSASWSRSPRRRAAPAGPSSASRSRCPRSPSARRSARRGRSRSPALTISWALLRQDRPVAAGAFAGIAAACDPLAAFPALAIVLAGPAEVGPRWDPEPQVSPWKRLLPALGAYAALVLPVALLDLHSFAERVLSPNAIGPGLGVFNLLSYRGLESTVPASLLAARHAAARVGRDARPRPPGDPGRSAGRPRLARCAGARPRGDARRGRGPDRPPRARGGRSAERGLDGPRPASSLSCGGGLVPEAGLEPARISPHAPQTCVSANSTTPARGWTRLRAGNPIRSGRRLSTTALATRRDVPRSHRRRRVRPAAEWRGAVDRYAATAAAR